MFGPQIAKKKNKDYQSEIHDQSGESDKHQESGRQHDNSGDSRSNRDSWDVYVNHLQMLSRF